MIKIKIADIFTDCPGGRLRIHGKWSGEEFREKYLEKYFENSNGESIEIDLDGTFGYPPSFLEETFGGLVRKYGYDKVQPRLIFISEEEIDLETEIQNYMSEAKK